MSDADKESVEPEPVDAEFETIVEDEDQASRPKSGPGWILFGAWLLATAVMASGISWSLARFLPSPSNEYESRLAALEAASGTEPDTALVARVDQLESETRRIADQQDTVLGQFQSRLSDLDQAVERLSASPSQVPGNEAQDTISEDFSERLVILEQQLSGAMEALEALANAPQPIVTTDPGASSDPDPDIMQAIEAFQDRLAQVESRLAETESATQSRFDSVTTSLDEYDQRLIAIQNRVEQTASVTDTAVSERNAQTESLQRLSSRALALTALRDAASGSGPFEAERAALYRVWRDQSALRELQPVSRSGVETRSALLSGFPYQAVRDAAGQSRTLLGFIQMRPSDGRDEADGPLAIVSQIETRLGNDDLTGAVEAARRLTGEPANQASDWLNDAENRLMVERVLNQLRSDLAMEAEAREMTP